MNPTSFRTCAFVAYDDGPVRTIDPVARAAGARLVDTSAYGDSVEAWRAWLSAQRPPVLVCGTSASIPGIATEMAARRAAAHLGIPVACIEDFPGNYAEVAAAPTRLLIVESGWSRDLYLARGHASPIAVISPVRYDALRGQPVACAAARAPYEVLWAGQPETAHNVATLEWVLRALRTLAPTVLFRAHPRDPGVARGAYAPFAALLGERWIDVSAEPLAVTLAREFPLVVTQFSSVAVEAGFLGIPSLHVLLASAGGGALKTMKGYDTPAICAAGAAFLARDNTPPADVVAALTDETARQTVIARFVEAYRTDTPTLPMVMAALAGIIPR
ncbi:MAG: hypothetical protein ACREUW_03760 [Burkholderiales bacterium]